MFYWPSQRSKCAYIFSMKGLDLIATSVAVMAILRASIFPFARSSNPGAGCFAASFSIA